MTKITKLGLSAMVALALMFTTSVGVVAQEKVVAQSSGDIELNTTEALGFAKIVQKLGEDTMKSKDNSYVSANTVTKEPVEGYLRTENHRTGFRSTAPTNWYYKGPIDDPTEFNNPDNWQPEPLENVECDGTEDIPCSTNEVMDYAGLQTLLSTYQGSLLYTKVSRRDE